MSACKIAELESRAVISITSNDAAGFLQNLVTNGVAQIGPDRAVYSSLLTPQGKIMFDFLIAREGDGFLLDAPKAVAEDLVKRLTFYKLRAKVDIEDISLSRAVFAVWDGAPERKSDTVIVPDPRLDELGFRVIAPRGGQPEQPGCEQAGEADYHAHRIALGVPEGGLDFVYGDAFPHEAGLDQLHGVDFSKGCFVGQEVVSRMQHRGTARKRIVPVEGDDALEAGADVSAGGPAIGNLGSVAGNRGLALIRLDRAEKALGEGKPLEAGGKPIRLLQPAWASFTVPGSEAAGKTV